MQFGLLNLRNLDLCTLDLRKTMASLLVALTVTDAPVVGAVRTPPEVMDPAEVDQVMAEE